MNARMLCHAIVSACVVLSYFAPQGEAHAGELDFVEIPLEALHDEKPIELMGLISSRTLDLSLPQSWSVGEENWIEIRLVGSPLLDSARSSITVALNDHQVISYDLATVLDAKQHIHIPANLFGSGKNTLTFTSTLYLPDDPQTNCQNWDDPARWLRIESGGLLHLSFVRGNRPVDLADFPQVFVEPVERYLPDAARRQPLIVLPDDRTTDDLTALSAVSYQLGYDARLGFAWDPEILHKGEWNPRLARDRNVIFVGDAPAELEDQTSQGKDYVGLFPSPWSIGNAVLIIGDQDRQDGFTPASIFSDPARNILLHGNLAFVDRRPPAAPDPFPKKFSFNDLGYVDRTVRGIGQQSLTYGVFLPYDVQILLAKLKLDLFHSPNLDAGISSFRVYLNGHNIAAIIPGGRSLTADPITIGLPAKRFRRGMNFIRISFDLHPRRSSCEHNLESVWGTILSSSTIETVYRTRPPTPSLAAFPLPFSEPPGSLLVIPDRFQEPDIAHVSQLSFLLGASASQPYRPPEVVTATSFRPQETAHLNVILIGEPRENPVTSSINDFLPQPFSEDGHTLPEGYGVQFPTADKAASLGLLQILPSPWVAGGTVLVVTGNDPRGLDWTWDALLDPSLRPQFAGNLMVVGSSDHTQITAVDGLSAAPGPLTLFQEVADASNIPLVGPLLQKYGQAFMAPALVAVGAALFLVSVLFGIIEMVRSRRYRF